MIANLPNPQPPDIYYQYVYTVYPWWQIAILCVAAVVCYRLVERAWDAIADRFWCWWEARPDGKASVIEDATDDPETPVDEADTAPVNEQRPPRDWGANTVTKVVHRTSCVDADSPFVRPIEVWSASAAEHWAQAERFTACTYCCPFTEPPARTAAMALIGGAVAAITPGQNREADK